MEPQAKRSTRDVGDGSPSDGQLVERANDGDRKAFDELIVRYQRQAVAVSYRLLGNTQDDVGLEMRGVGDGRHCRFLGS